MLGIQLPVVLDPDGKVAKLVDDRRRNLTKQHHMLFVLFYSGKLKAIMSLITLSQRLFVVCTTRTFHVNFRFFYLTSNYDIYSYILVTENVNIFLPQRYHRAQEDLVLGHHSGPRNPVYVCHI